MMLIKQNTQLIEQNAELVKNLRTYIRIVKKVFQNILTNIIKLLLNHSVVLEMMIKQKKIKL